LFWKFENDMTQNSDVSTTSIASVDVFKALADPIRLRIINLLLHRDELCVCHLIDVLSLPQSSISRHLGTLRHTGLVAGRKDKLWVYYRMTVDEQSPLFGLMRELSALHQHESVLADDLERVKHINC